jgi:RNA polymerase sigma factor (sigma-70 family)
MSESDEALLRRFADDGDREALNRLIQRNLDFVYSAALRHVPDPHLAEDVTQAVFLVLVQKARAIRRGTVVAGWLFNTARYASANAMKMRSRRAHHEQAAARARHAEDNATGGGREPAEAWKQLAPALDDALAKLRPADRDAVLLRFLRGQPLAEVGRALGVSEDAARKRVGRSLERLRSHLARAGVVLAVGEVSSAMLGHGSSPAPAHLLVTTTAGGTTSASAIAQAATRWIRWGEIKVAASMATAATVAVAIGVGLIRHAFAADQASPKPVAIAAAAPATSPVATAAPATEPAPATAPSADPKADEIQHRIQCATQMGEIGKVLLVYSERHGGKYPDNLAALVIANRVDLQWFVCPSSSQQLPDAPRMTPAQRAAWVTDHTDYVYIGKGQTNRAPADRILMYEKPGAHGGEGMNLLYADGHRQFDSAAFAKREIEAQERKDHKGEEGL